MIEFIFVGVICVIVGYLSYITGKENGKCEGWKEGSDHSIKYCEKYYAEEQKKAVAAVHDEYKMKELLKDKSWRY